MVVVKNKIVIKQQVHFGTGKSEHPPRQLTTLLDQVAEAITLQRNLTKVEIAGHTDNQGDKDANLQLSQDRAESVAAYLVKKGIDPGALISSKGYGDTKPIAPNMTAKGRES